VKRSRTLIVGGAVVVLLVVGFIVVKALPKKSAAPATQTIQLSKVDRDKIASITLKHGDVTLHLNQKDKKWVVDYPYPIDWDQSSLTDIADAFSSLYADRKIESDPTDLSQFGLAPPLGTAVATLDDGTKVSYLLGNKTPAGGSYYFMKEGDKALYAVSSFTAGSLLSTIDSLRNKTLPNVDSKSITYARVTTKGRTMEIVPIPKDNPLAFVSFADMELAKPFPVARPVDSSAFSKMFQTYPAYFQIQKFINDRPTNLAEYGLAPPVASYELKDSKDQSIHLLVGKTLPDGTVYAKLAGEPGVFTVNLSDIKSVLDVTPFELEDKFLLIPNIDNVESFTIATQSATYEAKIVRTPEKDAKPDAKGKIPTNDTYFLNAKEIKGPIFKDFYQDVIGLLADSPNPNPRIPMRPEVTVTFHLNKGAGAYREYMVPYNRDFYAVYRDGLADVLLSKDQVVKMVDKARELVK